MLYFAYGANMDVRHMKGRVPDARVVGPGRLDGFRMAFDVYSTEWEGGAANLQTDQERHVWGVLWEVPESEAGGLDAFQGHPTFYRREDVVVSTDIDDGKLREPTDLELKNLLTEHFQRGRILDQRRHEGKSRDLYYLVYREPDGRVYALMAAPYKGRYRIVIPEVPMSRRHRYLWDYTWTN